jgi:hypothetical protein
MRFALSRPVINGRRCTPAELLQYCASHNIRTPCCLCAVGHKYITYMESDVRFDIGGQYPGEWVVRCATNTCKYIGDLSL